MLGCATACDCPRLAFSIFVTMACLLTDHISWKSTDESTYGTFVNGTFILKLLVSPNMQWDLPVAIGQTINGRMQCLCAESGYASSLTVFFFVSLTFRLQ